MQIDERKSGTAPRKSRDDSSKNLREKKQRDGDRGGGGKEQERARVRKGVWGFRRFATGYIAAFDLHVRARFCAGRSSARRRVGCPVGYDLSHRRPAAALVFPQTFHSMSAQPVPQKCPRPFASSSPSPRIIINFIPSFRDDRLSGRRDPSVILILEDLLRIRSISISRRTIGSLDPSHGSLGHGRFLGFGRFGKERPGF